MQRLFRTLAWTGVAALLVPVIACAQESKPEAKWVSIFDGKSLDGWEVLELRGPGTAQWSVKDGAIVGTGQPSMLFSPKGDYRNFRVRAEININDKGNSGFYFRTAKKPSFGDGYEAQIDSTHTDPIRTGSIYGMVHVFKQHVPPGEWFTYELHVQDTEWRNRPVTEIRVSINGEELYRYLDFNQTFKQGHFAFQGHDPGSTVQIRKVEVMELP